MHGDENRAEYKTLEFELSLQNAVLSLLDYLDHFISNGITGI